MARWPSARVALLITHRVQGSTASRAALVGRLRDAGCVFAEDEARLLAASARTATDLDAMVARRVSGVPLEHVLGWAEFCGMRIEVAPEVFVPRRRTELLVQQALAYGSPGAVVVDLCCGSGAVGAAVAAGLGRVELFAVDVHPAAVRCARRNLAAAGGRVYAGDLYAPLPDSLLGRVDLLVANPPYVPTDQIELMPGEARRYEPREALDGGGDGLDVQRRVIDGAPAWLAPGGWLLVETSEPQLPKTLAACRAAGLRPRVARSSGLDATAVAARRRPGRS